MTPERCLRILTDEVKSAVKNFRMRAEYQSDKAVTVYEQYLPKSNFKQDTYYPLVLTEITDVTDNSEFSAVNFVITVGVYGGEDDNERGYEDMLHLAEEIRQRLLQRPILGDAMLFDFPLHTQIEPNQPVPFFFCYLDCQYRIMRPTVWQIDKK